MTTTGSEWFNGATNVFPKVSHRRNRSQIIRERADYWWEEELTHSQTNTDH